MGIYTKFKINNKLLAALLLHAMLILLSLHRVNGFLNSPSVLSLVFLLLYNNSIQLKSRLATSNLEMIDIDATVTHL